MKIIDWDSFETLMQVATGKETLPENMYTGRQEGLLRNLYDKREQLEIQHERFLCAGEDSILQEYRQMQRAHDEFLHCYKKTYRFLSQQSDQDAFEIPLS